MSSSNQATELSMDDILASIRRIIAEEPAGKGSKSAPRMSPLPEPADAAKDVPVEIAQRGARSSFNQLTQRLNEVLDTQEPAVERKHDPAKDTSLGLGKPEDLDQPYTSMRKPPPESPPPSEEAAPTRVVSASSEMLRRQVWSQTDGNINNRLGRLDPKPLTTTLARAVGSAPAVAFDAYRRKSEAETSGPPAFRPAATPAADAKKPAPPPVAETKPTVPTQPPALPPEARSPVSAPLPPAVPVSAPVQSPQQHETPDVEGLAGRLAASMRDLDATLGGRVGDKADEPLATEADKGAKARSSALPAPKPWPESREGANSPEPAKSQPALEKAAGPTLEAKAEAKLPAVSEPAKPSAEGLLAPAMAPAPKEAMPVAKIKAPMPPVSSPVTDKAVTAAEAAAMLVKSASPLTAAKSAKPAESAVASEKTEPAEAKAAPMAKVAPAPAVPGVRTLEDTVSDLLRPVLRQWLDEHMPRIFERVLREELAGRVTPPPKP